MLMLWLLLVLVYGAIAYKVTEWQTISRLGFQSETPALYILKPTLYHWTSYLFLISGFLIPVISEEVPVWVVIVFGAEVFFLSVNGRTRALRNYRKILQELLAGVDQLDTKNNLLKELNLSDQEIWEKLKKHENMKTGLLRFARNDDRM